MEYRYTDVIAHNDIVKKIYFLSLSSSFLLLFFLLHFSKWQKKFFPIFLIIQLINIYDSQYMTNDGNTFPICFTCILNNENMSKYKALI